MTTHKTQVNGWKLDTYNCFNTSASNNSRKNYHVEDYLKRTYFKFILDSLELYS